MKDVGLRGDFVQPNGSLIKLRGGIMHPEEGAYVGSIADIEALPWTKNMIADAYMFRMCDEYIKAETTDWETKKKATYSLVYHSYGHIAVVDDENMKQIMSQTPYAEDDNGSMVQLWKLGDLSPPDLADVEDL